MGLFIVFEGQDGSGLSTQAELLKRFLVKRGHEVLLTKEQTVGFIGGIIKSVLRKEILTSPLALQMLFTADRAHHLYSEIEPALKEDKMVISDRYIFSTLAFGALDIDMKFLKTINSKFRVPDITFIIDVPPEVCLRRIGKSRLNHYELFEEKEKLEKIRATYLSLKDYFPNIHVIEGNRPIEKVSGDVQKIVLSKLR